MRLSSSPDGNGNDIGNRTAIGFYLVFSQFTFNNHHHHHHHGGRQLQPQKRNVCFAWETKSDDQNNVKNITFVFFMRKL